MNKHEPQVPNSTFKGAQAKATKDRRVRGTQHQPSDGGAQPETNLERASAPHPHS